jgi:hypothetical protein
LCQGTEELGEVGFAKTHEVVAHDPTGVFQSFVGSDGHLRGEALTVGKDGGADDGRELGIDEDLAAANHKSSILPGIASGLVHAIEFSALHAGTGRTIIRLGSGPGIA